MTRMMPDFLVDASKGQKPQLVEKIHIQQEKTKPKEQQGKNIQIKIDNLADFVRTQKEKSVSDENWKNEAQRRLNHILEEITQPYFEDKDFLEIYECYKIIEMLTPVLEVGNEMRAMLLWGIVELEKKHFGSMGRMLDYISPEVIPADDFTSIVIDVAWRGEISEDFKTNLIQHLQYNVVYSSEYRDKLLENIDLTNSEEIFKTIAYLNFIKRVYTLKHYHTQKTEEAGIDIYNKLIDKKESAGEQIIYFLDLFLEELLQEMSGNETHRDYDKFPFEVVQGIYGIHKNGVLYISQFEEHDKIKTKIASEQVALQAGNRPGNLQSHTMIDIPIGEILKNFSHLTPEEKEREQFNYSFLMTKPIREKIGAEFDFELSDLSIKEQFYFLNYAKHYTVADIYKLKRFLNSTEDKTGRLNRIRTFLSLEQGGLEMGEKILLIGERFREENKEIADGIFTKYAELVDTVYEIENYLKEQFEKEDPQLAQKVQEELLLTGKAVLKMFADEEMTAETARQRLEEINIQTNRFAITIQNLSREDIASLNLTRAKDSTLDIISNPAELLEDKNKKILNQILELVADKFPGENEESAFLADLQNDNTESVVISRLEKEVLSFFMKKKKTKGLYEIDWVTANNKSTAKGLGEATLVSGFKEAHRKGQEYQAVAKPFVKTFRIFIEKLGFVAHQGITADGEYAHHYAKMRRLQTDQNYSSKNFSPEQNRRFIKLLKHTTTTPNKVVKMEFANKQYQVVKIIFENTDYHQDITKNDPDGFIYREIEEQDKQGRVLTRFIPESYDKNNKTFYAVFE